MCFREFSLLAQQPVFFPKDSLNDTYRNYILKENSVELSVLCGESLKHTPHHLSPITFHPSPLTFHP